MHKQKGKIIIAIIEGENNNSYNKHQTNTILPLWKIHSSRKKKKSGRFFRKGAKDRSREEPFLEFGRKDFSLQ